MPWPPGATRSRFTSGPTSAASGVRWPSRRSWISSPSASPSPTGGATTTCPCSSHPGATPPIGAVDRERQARASVPSANAVVDDLQEVLDLRLAHRGRKAAEPGRRDQDAVIEQRPVQALQALLLGAIRHRAPVVHERPGARVNAKERSHSGDGARRSRALQTGAKTAAQRLAHL